MVHALLVGIAIVGQSQVLSDPGLERSITVRADAEPIRTLVSRIAEQTGVKLIADPSVGEDRIILFAKNLPAKEVLRKISDHFEWDWRLTKDGIQLWQTPAQKGAEQRALNEAILASLRKWRQESVDAMKSQRGAATAEQLAKIQNYAGQLDDQYDRYQDEYYGTPEQRKVWSERQRQLEGGVQDLARKISPSWQLYDSIVASMSDQDLLQLEANGKRTIAYAPKGSQYGMSAVSRRLAESFVAGLSSREQQTTGERDISRSMGTEMFFEGKPEDAQNVRLQLKTASFPIASTGITSVDTPVLTVVDTKRRRIAEKHLSIRNANRPPEGRKPEPAKSDERPKDLLDEPLEVSEELKVATDGNRQSEVNIQFLQRGEVVFRSHPSAIVLNEIANSAKVNFISDCYEANRFESLRAVPLTTARTAYTHLARANRENFVFEKGWAAFRDPSPAVGRAYSVPSDRLLAFRDAIVQPFSLDRASQAIHPLSSRHLTTNLIQSLVYSEWGLVIRSNRGVEPFLRCWATMSSGAKKTLLAGKPARLSSFGTASVAYLWRYLEDQDRDFVGATDFGPNVDASDWTWIKENWASNEDLFLDRDLDELLPSGFSSSASISLRQSTSTALSILDPGFRWGRPRGAHSAVISGSFNPDKDEYKLKMVPEGRAIFTVELAEGLRRGFVLRTFGKPGEKVYEKIADLPEDFRKKMELDYRARRGG